MAKKGIIKGDEVPEKSQNVEKALIENFIALQKVMTNLSLSFDKLSDNISKLLELFEISAKTLAEKDFKNEKTGNSQDISKKLDSLIDQNKIIARGLSLLHEANMPVESDRTEQQRKPQLLSQKRDADLKNDYQKSISLRP